MEFIMSPVFVKLWLVTVGRSVRNMDEILVGHCGSDYFIW